jgi:carboxyl-terminal processing protease
LEARHPCRRALLLAVVMVPFSYVVVPLPAAAGPGDPLKNLHAQAEQYERLGDWEHAADKYEEVLRLDRSYPGAKARYNHCLRRYFQAARLRDPSYRKDVLSLSYHQALRMYEIVLFNLLHNTLDKKKINAGLLFRRGLEEYRYALASAEFCLDHLGGLKPQHTSNFRKLLQDTFVKQETMTLEQTIDCVRDVAMKSTNAFPEINATTVVMEFVCGACYALDDYTVYLTPRQLRELCDTLKGSYVGIGLRLKMEDNKLLIADILADSPAAEVMPVLSVNDQVVNIDGKSTVGMPLEVAMGMLEGEEGTFVRITV